MSGVGLFRLGEDDYGLIVGAGGVVECVERLVRGKLDERITLEQMTWRLAAERGCSVDEARDELDEMIEAAEEDAERECEDAWIDQAIDEARER